MQANQLGLIKTELLKNRDIRFEISNNRGFSGLSVF